MQQRIPRFIVIVWCCLHRRSTTDVNLWDWPTWLIALTVSFRMVPKNFDGVNNEKTVCSEETPLKWEKVLSTTTSCCYGDVCRWCITLAAQRQMMIERAGQSFFISISFTFCAYFLANDRHTLESVIRDNRVVDDDKQHWGCAVWTVDLWWVAALLLNDLKWRFSGHRICLG